MNWRWARITLVGACLALMAGHYAAAQNKGPGGGPGGPPPAPHGPGGPNGPPSNGPTGNQPPANSGGGGTSRTTRGGSQFGPPGRWWDDKTVTSTIGLRRDQQKKMDAIFDANKSAILSSYKTLLSEQAKLDELNKQPQADTTRLFATIDAVNQARASLQKATTEMLLQIRGQMEPDQIVKLEKVDK
jgi:Spy/CpxP family protein refolding chaperone